MTTTPIPAGADLPQGALTEAEKAHVLGYLSRGHADDFVERVRAALVSRHHVIAEFLERTGQYVTNDASREAAIKEAVDAALAARSGAAGKCEGCNGHGMVGGLLPGDGGYDGQECPLCKGSGATAAAGVPALLNQCDGCAVCPAVNRFGNHDMPDGSKMACTAYRYRAPLAAQTETQPASEALSLVIEAWDRYCSGGRCEKDAETFVIVLNAARRDATPAQPAPAPGAGKEKQ